jgi:hypothetical protein
MKRLLTLFLAIGNTAHAQEAVPKIYELSVLSENKNVRIVVNGFPLATLPDEGNQGSLETLLSPFLKTGANELRVETTPLVSAGGDVDAVLAFRCASKPTIDSDERTIEFEVERTDNPASEQPNARTVVRLAGNDLYRLNFPGSATGDAITVDFPARTIASGPGADGISRIAIAVDFADAPLAALPWDGPEVVLDDADRAAILTKIAAFHQAISNRDFAEIAVQLDAKYTRISTAVGVAKADLIASETALLSQFLGKPGFVVKPLDSAALVFEPVPGINLVRVTSATGGAIQGADADVEFSVAPYFSKSGADWILVE